MALESKYSTGGYFGRVNNFDKNEYDVNYFTMKKMEWATISVFVLTLDAMVWAWTAALFAWSLENVKQKAVPYTS